MQLLIANLKETEEINKSPFSQNWKYFQVQDLYPVEIGKSFSGLLEKEDDDNVEMYISTNSPTILNLVGYDYDNFPITYEDVYVYKNGEAVPLLDLHTKEWLCHFYLGTILEQGIL